MTSATHAACEVFVFVVPPHLADTAADLVARVYPPPPPVRY